MSTFKNEEHDREKCAVLQVSSENTPLLKTPNFHLRTISEQDYDAFFDIYSDAETLKYWSGSPIKEHEQAIRLVTREMKNAQSANCINWGIALPETDLLIGKCTLFDFNPQNQRAEIGYILNRRHWGKGIMSEVMQRVLKFAFEELMLHRVEADTDPDNKGSLALLEKFGFQREGYFRERWFVQDKWLDSVMLGLLKSDYMNP